MTLYTLAETLSAPGSGTPTQMFGPFNLNIWGTFTGSLRLERSFDEGVTWIPCTALGTAIAFTTPASETILEPESGVFYRVTATALSSGTANWRLSK